MGTRNVRKKTGDDDTLENKPWLHTSMLLLFVLMGNDVCDHHAACFFRRTFLSVSNRKQGGKITERATVHQNKFFSETKKPERQTKG